MSSRWAAANRKNLTDAPTELLTFIEANRHRVEEKVRTAKSRKLSGAAEWSPPWRRSRRRRSAERLEADTLPTSPDINPDEPHPYQDWSGKCVVCTLPESNERHDS